MRRSNIKIALTVLMVLVFMLLSADIYAQCPMCRMAAESNLENGGTAGRGLNNGILYMLATPYLIIGIIGFVWWRNRVNAKEKMEPINEDIV